MKVRVRFSAANIILFVLSLVYIGAEIVFNARLLDVAGSVRSSPDELDRLQLLGRALSACGFCLLAIGLFSVTGFRLETGRSRFLFAVIAALCLIPAPLTLAGVFSGVYLPQDLEIMLSLLPVMGLVLIAASRGHFRFFVVLSLLFLVWPAAFLGQHVFIERYLIGQTTWQERQEARHMLMLRAGLEDCKMELKGLQFCDARLGTADMKAARIVISTLWMLNPKGIMQDLKASREALVENAAVRGVWFSPHVQYSNYVYNIENQRSRYIKEMLDKYYYPYQAASEAYAGATNSRLLQEGADDAAEKIEAGIDEGWNKYQEAMASYRFVVSGGMGTAVRTARQADQLCAKLKGKCPALDMKAGVRQGRAKAAEEFSTLTGYPPVISSREEFSAHPVTQEKIRPQVEEHIRVKFGFKAFVLPPEWKYSSGSFRDSIGKMVQQQVKTGWEQRFGNKLPPGLDVDEFMATLGVSSPPPVEQLVMSEEEFFRKHVLPGNQKIVDDMLKQLERDMRLYPATASDMEEGKDYVRALYIPSAALVMSLVVVALTLLRGASALARAFLFSGTRKTGVWERGIVQGAVAAFFFITLVSLPTSFPNPYAQGGSYQRYLVYAGESHGVIASVLDWAVHTQPLIYRASFVAGR